jgi:hypothetical protein
MIMCFCLYFYCRIPKKLDRIEDGRLVWTNFDQLVDAPNRS